MDFELKVRDETCLDVGGIGTLSPPVFFLNKEFFGPSFALKAWKLGGERDGQVYVYEFSRVAKAFMKRG